MAPSLKCAEYQLNTSGPENAQRRHEVGLSTDTQSQDLILQWFAVFVKTHSERSVAGMLKTKGFEQFVPMYKETHQWRDRRKQVEVALFSRYVFCRFDRRFRVPILKTPGVLSIVGTPAGPIPVEPYEIDALRQMTVSGVLCQPWTFIQRGQRVRVRYGALSGIEGLFLRSKRGCRLVLSITLLQRSVAIELDSDWVECVPNGSR
jgi:transcription antitermination factor NusG